MRRSSGVKATLSAARKTTITPIGVLATRSGKETTCPTSFGPVGNFNTHGGAATGNHFRGNYGTLIYKDNSTNSPCPDSSPNYCIQVHLVGQTN